MAIILKDKRLQKPNIYFHTFMSQSRNIDFFFFKNAVIDFQLI